jgi:ADP-ribosylglycohydrolase
MLPTSGQLRTSIAQVIADKAEQGHVVDGLDDELNVVPESYDALIAFAHRLADLPLRADWSYVEPDDVAAIKAESDPARSVTAVDVPDASDRIRAAFYARVSGCMLGKGFEVGVTADEIEAALRASAEWPLSDYPSEAALRALPTLQGQWRELARERISHVAVDDDVNYTILAMLALERHGAAFTHDDLQRLWQFNLPVLATFGPERTILIRSALHSLATGDAPYGEWVRVLNPGAELCGALIRADAYAYACLGHPERAAELAHRDASFTHQRTGIYGAMFAAAAIAVAPLVDEPLDAFREALRYVPQKSRFAERTYECLAIVDAATDRRTAHTELRMRFGEYGFCRIYQEVGTLANTLRFATDAGDGICLQVMQGLDTDSFGATAGSILGAHFGTFDPRWYAPFNDDVQTALAIFHERSLSSIADRMAALPSRIV